MNVFTKRFRAVLSTKWIFPLVFGLISIFSLRWFHGDDFILAGDLGWPLDFKRFFELTLSLWDRSAAPGYLASRQPASIFPFALYGYLFDLLGIPSSIFQRITYLVSFFFSGFGFYLLMKRMNVSSIVSFVTGLFYMLSPYALIVVWNPAYGQTFPFYAYFPLIMFFFYNYLDSKGIYNKQLYYGLLLSVLSFIGASFSNPAFLILLFLGFAFIFFISLNNGTDPIWKKSITYISLYLLLNSFWIFPLVGNIHASFSGADNSIIGVVGDFETRYINSVSFVDGLKLEGLWTMHDGQQGDPYYTFSSYWSSSFYIISAYVFTLLSIFLYITYPSKRGSIALVFFLFILFLVAGLKGNRLIKNFAELSYYTPYLGRVFRTVYLKFGSVLVFFFALFLGFVLDKVISFYKNILAVILVILIIINGHPFFTGSIIKDAGKVLPSFTTTIPEDYYLISDYINFDKDDFKVLILPMPLGYNYTLSWESGGYTGAEYLRTLISKPLYYIGGLPYNKSLFSSLDLASVGNSNVKYVILRKDIHDGFIRKGYLTNDWDAIFTLLDSKGITKIVETNNLVLYKLSSDLITPLFYSDEDIHVTYSSLPNNMFKIVVESSTPDSIFLSFNEGFSSDWELFSFNKENTDIERVTNEVSINTWHISGNTSYTLYVYHKGQLSLYLGLFTSAVTFLYLLFTYLRVKNAKTS